MLPKTAEYALRAVVWLARHPDQPESANSLAAATQVPRRYLHKVLQDLVRADLVHSQPGPGGGYYLAKDPEDVSILDVVNAMGTIDRIRACPLGLTSHTTLCPLHQELDRVYEATEAAFAHVTIAQLVHSTAQKPPLCKLS